MVVLSLGAPPNYIQECIKEVYRIGNSQNERTSVEASRSSWEIWKESSIFKVLLNKILNITYKEFVDDKRSIISIKSAWSAIYKKGNYAKLHDHEPCWMSFVYYLKNSGNTPLIFEAKKITEPNPIKLEPKKDLLVLFPSYIRHEVPVHESEEDRICIAGNIELKMK